MGTHPQQGGPPQDTPWPRSRPAPNLAAGPHLETMTGVTRWGRRGRACWVRGRAQAGKGEAGSRTARPPRNPWGNRVTAGGGPPRGPRCCHVPAGHRWRARQLWTPGCARSSGAGGGATNPRGPERGWSAGAKNSPGRGLRSAASALSVLVCLSLGPSLPAPPPALATPLWPGPADRGQWAPPGPPGGVRASPWAQGQECGWPAPTRELSAPGPPEPGPLFALPPTGPALFTIWAAPKAGRRNQPPRRPDPRPGLYAGEPGGLGPGTQ